MSFVELLTAVVMVSLALWALVWTADSLRSNDARNQTDRTLTILHEALDRYYEAHQNWMPGPTDRALTTLLEDPQTAPIMQHLTLTFDAAGRPVVRDGFSQPIRYQPPVPGAYGAAEFLAADPEGRFTYRAAPSFPGTAGTAGTPGNSGNSGNSEQPAKSRQPDDQRRQGQNRAQGRETFTSSHISQLHCVKVITGEHRRDEL